MNLFTEIKEKLGAVVFQQKAERQSKIFCISFQRTGTTSVGQFFINHGFPVATWEVSRKNLWTRSWFDSDYEKIFDSPDFKNNVVFEDGPWACMDFYKLLYHRFPGSKFILFTRDPDKWFDSMISHSDGRTIGNTYRHSRIYNRETEFDEKIGENYSYAEDTLDNLLEINESHREHYKKIYLTRNNDVLNFFGRHDKSRFVHCELEDKNKWKKLGGFFHLEVDETIRYPHKT